MQGKKKKKKEPVEKIEIKSIMCFPIQKEHITTATVMRLSLNLSFGLVSLILRDFYEVSS